MRQLARRGAVRPAAYRSAARPRSSRYAAENAAGEASADPTHPAGAVTCTALSARWRAALRRYRTAQYRTRSLETADGFRQWAKLSTSPPADRLRIGGCWRPLIAGGERVHARCTRLRAVLNCHPLSRRCPARRQVMETGTARYGPVRRVVWGPEANYLRLPDWAPFSMAPCRD